MTLDMLLKIGSTAAIILSFALNLYLFLRAKSDDRFDRINERLDRIAKSLSQEVSDRRADFSRLEREHAVLEAVVKGLPTHDDLSEIREELTSQTRTLSAVNQRSETTLASVNRIEAYLMDRRQ